MEKKYLHARQKVIIESECTLTCIIFFFLVNYRGSLGYGQDNVLSLPGNVGSQDVKDVQVSMNDS